MKMNEDYLTSFFLLTNDLVDLAKKYNDIELVKITKELNNLLKTRLEGEKK